MITADVLEFEVPFRSTALLGTRWTPSKAAGTALLLHGGSSSAERFRDLRMFLNERNIGTVAFDFVGHGRTGGVQLGTTLEERVRQVEAVIASQGLKPSSLSLIGFSMGAYVAVKAAVEAGVPRLCLAVPAAYAPEAFRTPFGPQFTQILRTPRSWEKSDAFTLVRDYAGHLLVISAEEDKVVPSEIPQKYALHSERRASTAHHVVRRSDHNLSEHYEREPLAREVAYHEIALLCRRGEA